MPPPIFCRSIYTTSKTSIPAAESRRCLTSLFNAEVRRRQTPPKIHAGDRRRRSHHHHNLANSVNELLQLNQNSTTELIRLILIFRLKRHLSILSEVLSVNTTDYIIRSFLEYTQFVAFYRTPQTAYLTYYL